MSKTIVASLAGNWVLAQKNGGPKKLGMVISGEGEISLTFEGKPLSHITGAAYAGEANTDGQYPVLMSIYSTSSDAAMGLSITNYTGVFITSDLAGGDILEGTAIGIQDKASESSPVEIFGWSAYHLNV
jgi:hypothetical protein